MAIFDPLSESLRQAASRGKSLLVFETLRGAAWDHDKAIKELGVPTFDEELRENLVTYIMTTDDLADTVIRRAAKADPRIIRSAVITRYRPTPVVVDTVGPHPFAPEASTVTPS